MSDRAAPAGPAGGRPRLSWRRLGVPPGITVVTQGVLAALIVGALGAATAGWLGWRSGPLPGGEAAKTIVATALPGQPVESTSRRDVAFGYSPPADKGIDRWLVPVLGGGDYGPGSVDVTLNPVVDPSAALSQARELLRSAGWRVSPVRMDRYGGQLTSVRDGLALTINITALPGPDGVVPGRYEPAVSATVYRSPPRGIEVQVFAGWLVGLLVGWLATVAVAWLAAARPVARRQAMASLTGFGLVWLLPATVLTMLFNASYAVPGRVTPDAYGSPWDAYMIFIGRAPFAFGIGCLVVGFVVGFLPARRRRAPLADPPRPAD